VNEQSVTAAPYRAAVPAALADYASAGGQFHFESSRSEQAPLEIRFWLSDPGLYDRLLLKRMAASDPATQAGP